MLSLFNHKKVKRQGGMNISHEFQGFPFTHAESPCLFRAWTVFGLRFQSQELNRMRRIGRGVHCRTLDRRFFAFGHALTSRKVWGPTSHSLRAGLADRGVLRLHRLPGGWEHHGLRGRPPGHMATCPVAWKDSSVVQSVLIALPEGKSERKFHARYIDTLSSTVHLTARTNADPANIGRLDLPNSPL